MKLIEINWQPTDRQLRQFGMVCFLALPTIAWFWGGSTPIIAMLAVIGLLCATAGVLYPQALKPFFLALTLVATPIGIVIGELVMLTIYFGVFLPLSLLFRISQRDSLGLLIVRNQDSYWEVKKKPRDVASYYRQS